MTDPTPSVSILMRAHNDEALIGRALKAIFAQKTDLKFEVVVCDDASTDGTREVAAMFPVRFFERPEGEYRPGRTLNPLVRAAAYARLTARLETARRELSDSLKTQPTA